MMDVGLYTEFMKLSNQKKLDLDTHSQFLHLFHRISDRGFSEGLKYCREDNHSYYLEIIDAARVINDFPAFDPQHGNFPLGFWTAVNNLRDAMSGFDNQ